MGDIIPAVSLFCSLSEKKISHKCSLILFYAMTESQKRLERWMGRLIGDFFGWESSFLALQVALPTGWRWSLKKVPFGCAAFLEFLHCDFSPDHLRLEKLQKKQSFPGQERTRERKINERGETVIVFLLLISFHCQLEISRHHIVRVVTSY